MWCAPRSFPVSYPADGNRQLFAIEAASFWFRHRIACIREVIRNHPFPGTFCDIGGGNGQLAQALQADGHDVVLCEPGDGAANGVLRGVRKVIQSPWETLDLPDGRLAAAGIFDVLEHIDDDRGFLHSIHRKLAPDGRLYCSVPAFPVLWSAEDDHAGHFRRYRLASLRSLLNRAGFEVEFCTYFFAWLILPVAFLRAFPSRLKMRSRSSTAMVQTLDDHRLPALLRPFVAGFDRWELRRLGQRRRIPMGTSLLCVAKPHRN